MSIRGICLTKARNTIASECEISKNSPRRTELKKALERTEASELLVPTTPVFEEPQRREAEMGSDRDVPLANRDALESRTIPTGISVL